MKKQLSYIKRKAKQIGAKVAYPALLLVYAYKRKETPRWAKNVALGALAYLVSPIDALPDLTPLIGYSDDLTMISAALGAIAMHIDTGVKTQAKEKLDKWFPEYDEAEILEVIEKDKQV